MQIELIKENHLKTLTDWGETGFKKTTDVMVNAFNRKIIKNKNTKVVKMPFNEVVHIFGSVESVVFAVHQQILGDVKADAYLLLKSENAEKIIDSFFEGMLNLDEEKNSLSEMQEMGNIMIGSLVSQLSNQKGFDFQLLPPEYVIDEVGAILIDSVLKYALFSNEALIITSCIEFLDKGGQMDFDLMIVLDQDSLPDLFKKLDVCFP